MAGRRGRGYVPPILTLLELIEEHRGAFEYDWRSRFHLRAAFPEVMGWGEAWRLTQLLLRDPSSQLAAALAGWQFPASREYLTLMDTFDLHHMLNAKKMPEAMRRPWDVPPRRLGSAAMSPESMRVLLDQHRGTPTVSKPGRCRDSRGRFVKT